MKYISYNILRFTSALLLPVSLSVMLGACGGGTDEALSAGASAGTAGAAAAGAGNPTMEAQKRRWTTYSVGGSLSGLNSGASVVLRNNGGDSVALSANTTFSFPTKLANTATYAVTVYTQPVGQKCTVTNGSGTINAANITNVSVACVTTPIATYSVGGTVSGLNSGASVVLRNNGTDSLTLSANSSFTFATKLANAAPYAVTVYTQPVGQKCTVTNASGTIPAANVANVGVACVASIAPPTAKMLFKSNFGAGVSLSAPYSFSTHGAWQDLLGTDSETGYTFSGANKPGAVLNANFFGVQSIVRDTTLTATNIGDHLTNEIRTVTGPKGTPVNELFQSVKMNGGIGSWSAQSPLLLRRSTTAGDVTDLYISYWFKHQADLNTRLVAGTLGNSRVQFEFKTGGYLGNAGQGDYRIQTTVMQGTDGLYWMTKGDNVANGPWPQIDYWRIDSHTVPVPVDKWFKYEVFWHRSTGSDGRYWSAVNGQVVVDRYGPNMGDYNLPIDRIFIVNPYSGSDPTVESQVTSFEIWDGFPCGVGKSCYVAP